MARNSYDSVELRFNTKLNQAVRIVYLLGDFGFEHNRELIAYSIRGQDVPTAK